MITYKMYQVKWYTHDIILNLFRGNEESCLSAHLDQKNVNELIVITLCPSSFASVIKLIIIITKMHTTYIIKQNIVCVCGWDSFFSGVLFICRSSWTIDKYSAMSWQLNYWSFNLWLYIQFIYSMHQQVIRYQ
jgi:hypothetical protein